MTANLPTDNVTFNRERSVYWGRLRLCARATTRPCELTNVSYMTRRRSYGLVHYSFHNLSSTPSSFVMTGMALEAQSWLL